MTIRMNDGWSFALLPLDTPLETAAEAAFQPVDLPHDFLIGHVADLYADGEGWYRRTLTAPDAPRCFLRFDGVYMDSTLYVNGVPALEWKYGYTTFEAELTGFLHAGENELLLRVQHRSPNTRWYSGAGIFRDVWLKTSGTARFVSDGVYVSTAREGEGWRLTVSAETENAAGAAIRHRLLGEGGAVLAESESVDTEQALCVSGVRAWGFDDRALYTLVSTLVIDGRPVDEVQTRVGFREAVFDADRGFLLNGAHYKLNGVCMHHDLGALGAAYNRAASRRQLEMLRSMGVNAIRTSHNPPAPPFLDLCDEMGFVVLDEFTDMWERAKTTYDYARFFPEWHERDVAAWVRRDRNHPCVVAWSIGNEIYDTHADERGLYWTRVLRDLARSHDPRHNAYITSGSNYMPWENAQKCAEELELVGYNYAERLYERHHAEHPGWRIYGSETYSIVQSRGVYHFPLSEPILADDDLQCSSLGNSGTSWGAKSIESCLCDDRDAAFSAGTFLWTGFDYIGEPTPYHTKNSYFGVIDTAGFPKDPYYVLRAQWTDAPMVHVYPHWDWNEGQIIDVRVCANLPRVRLWLNGRLIGERALDRETGRQLQADFAVPYEKGELKAEALDAAGNVIVTETRRSFGDAKRLVLAAERSSIRADGEDMAFLTISAVDADGNPVENANNRVRVRVEGAARLVGLDNGDSTDTDEYQCDSRRLFSGKLLAMLMARREAGEIRVTVESEGLESASLSLAAEAAEAEIGVAASYEVAQSAGRAELPVRRINLACANTALTAEHPEATVTATLLPANASYRDVEWRAANDAGVTTNLAEVRADGLRATVRALGDGAFWLRCMTRNGGDTPMLISMLRFTVSGCGAATLDPYAFVSAALYTVSSGQVASGLERGMSIPPDSEGMFGFERVDFGPYGSDEITMPVFALDGGTLCNIEIWDGVPGQGGEKLLDAPYQKPPIWSVYQEETWKLPRRLRGLHTLCLASGNRLHIKGFVFRKLERAWGENPAAEADAIYGDRFVVEGGRVLEIGNNVTLRFEGMDFGAGARRLTLRGRSEIDRNTLRVRFVDESGAETVQSVEFTRSDGYEERTFEVEGFKGRGAVEFVFLPGSQFDFDGFRFEEGN